MKIESIEKFRLAIESCLKDEAVLQELSFLLERESEQEVVSSLVDMINFYIEGEKL